MDLLVSCRNAFHGARLALGGGEGLTFLSIFYIAMGMIVMMMMFMVMRILNNDDNDA